MGLPVSSFTVPELSLSLESWQLFWGLLTHLSTFLSRVFLDFVGLFEVLDDASCFSSWKCCDNSVYPSPAL